MLISAGLIGAAKNFKLTSLGDSLVIGSTGVTLVNAYDFSAIII
jgi:hypothetical protein